MAINWQAPIEYGELSDDDKSAIQEIIRIWQTDPVLPDDADKIIAKYEKMLETGWGRKAGTFPAPVLPARPKHIDHATYIASPEWKAKAARIKQERGNRCQTCGATGVQLEAHHNTYDRLGHEDDADIVVLCDICHETFHKNRSLA